MSQKKKIISFGTIILGLLLITVLVACEPEDESIGVIPTIAPEFEVPTPIPTFTALPTLTRISNPTPTPELPLKTILIYDDQFVPGWGLVGEDLLSEPSEDVAFDGTRALKITPRLAFSQFFIVATSDNREPVFRDDIIAVSFYLRSTEPIAFDDMTITAQGSNENIYWIEDDRSAITTSGARFEDTQLAFTGLGTIPADTWARIEFLPQEQQFDPVYRNFTGFYLSNASTFLAPYYIDRIEILVVDE